MYLEFPRDISYDKNVKHAVVCFQIPDTPICTHYVVLMPPCVPDLSNIYSPITIFSLFCGNFWVASLGFDPEAKTLEGKNQTEPAENINFCHHLSLTLKSALRIVSLKIINSDNVYHKMCVSRKCPDPHHGGNFNCKPPPTPSDFPFPQDKVNPLTLRISKNKYLPAPVSLEIVFVPLKGFKS